MIIRDFFFFSVGSRKDVAEPEMRRRAASLSTPHRGSDVNVDPLHSAILFRDARGVSIQFINLIETFLSLQMKIIIHILSII